MGFFSKTCAKTHLPVLAHMGWHRDAPRLTMVVCLVRGEEPFHIEYDGYGLGRGADWDKVKFVLQSDYQGELYDQLPESHDEPNQGWFHSEELMKAMAATRGFPTYDAYEDALRDFEQVSDVISDEVLAELHIPFEAGRSYKVVQVLSALSEGQTMRAQEYLTALPALTGRTLADLLPKAEPFREAVRQRSTTLSAELMTKYALPAL